MQQQVIVGDSWGVRVRGSNNVIERSTSTTARRPGIFIASGANNLILNCDSHHNYDPLEGGGNGDGFGCHSTRRRQRPPRLPRPGRNSDDGYDFINAAGHVQRREFVVVAQRLHPRHDHGRRATAPASRRAASAWPPTRPVRLARRATSCGSAWRSATARRASTPTTTRRRSTSSTTPRSATRSNFNMLADVGLRVEPPAAQQHRVRSGTAISNAVRRHRHVQLVDVVGGSHRVDAATSSA